MQNSSTRLTATSCTSAGWIEAALHHLPGIALSAALAASALLARRLPGASVLSPAILAILLGIAARPLVGPATRLRPGLTFAARPLLRLAVMLLGLQVTLGQVAALGLSPLLAVAGGLSGCVLVTLWLGRLLGVAPPLTRLIATGTAVCGASAVAAASHLDHGTEEDTAYAVATVTLFGTLAMLAMPTAVMLLGLDPTVGGVWLGASIHEVAQVVGGASQLGDAAMRTATVAKMARILMLAPLILALAAAGRRGRAAGTGVRVPMPWFVVGFLALATLSSLRAVPTPVISAAAPTATFMLATALAAMGVSIDVRAIGRRGIRPLLLAALSWLTISAVSLGLLRVLG